jgi:hypothetical protein
MAMENDAMNCIVCNNPLDPVDIHHGGQNQPYGGLAFTSYGHYGGTAFDPMDGSYLEINICDKCLVSKSVLRESQKPVVLIGHMDNGPLRVWEGPDDYRFNQEVK